MEAVVSKVMSGPPLKVKLVAWTMGVSMDALKKIWDALSGYKTVIGLVILNLPILWGVIESILKGAGVDVAAVSGTVIVVIGVLHKAYKIIFGEEPKA